MQINHILLSLALGLSLVACKTTPPIKVPEKVYITVEKIPELTAEQKKLLEDCPIEEPKALTVEESVRVNKARKTSLANCNVDKKGIRSWFEK